MNVKRARGNTDHSYFFEIIDDLRQILTQHGLVNRLQLGMEVTRVFALGVGAQTAHGRPDHQLGWFSASGMCGRHPGALAKTFNIPSRRSIVLCTNRRLGVPRQLNYDGEELFEGVTRRGLSGDNVEISWSGACVIIIGHGPYAVEQARTALDHEAESAIFLVRRHGLVCPAIIDYLNIIRPFLDDFTHLKDGSGQMIRLWRKAYAVAHATPPETWERGVFRPDGHSVSVSDIYFVGHHAGVLGSKVTRIHHFSPNGIHTESSSFHAADIVLKCIGFQTNAGNERLLGRARLEPTGIVQPGLWAVFEHHLDEAANLLPLIGHVNAINFTAASFVASLHMPSGSGLHPRVRLNHMTASESTGSLLQVVTKDPEVHAFLKAHVNAIADDCQNSWSPEEYLESNMRQWDELNRQLLRETQAIALTYPFKGALQVLQEEAPALLESATKMKAPKEMKAPTSMSSIVEQDTVSVGAAAVLTPTVDSVLFMLLSELAALMPDNHLKLDADTPLEEIGLDSLAAGELMGAIRREFRLGVDMQTLLSGTPLKVAMSILEQSGADEAGGSEHFVADRGRQPLFFMKPLTETTVALGAAPEWPFKISNQIVFVFSSPRSGSTLLQLILSVNGENAFSTHTPR